ncbi:MAG: hypothetical protein SGPRY_008775 [Prymnesium sp.]
MTVPDLSIERSSALSIDFDFLFAMADSSSSSEEEADFGLGGEGVEDFVDDVGMLEEADEGPLAKRQRLDDPSQAAAAGASAAPQARTRRSALPSRLCSRCAASRLCA